VAEPLWQLAEVAVQSGAVRRLGPLSLTIPRGVAAVLGGSGAGKTTLLEVLVGYTRPDQGSVRFTPPDGGSVPLFWASDDGGLWPHLTVREHLEAVHGTPVDAALLAAFDLEECAHQKPGTLSLGQCGRLNVARALATGARVLVMDEPLAHVDPARRERYWQALREQLARNAASLVFATHEPRRALREAETAICLEGGRLAFCGSAEQLWRAPPTEALAWSLGEANWLPPAEAERWLGQALDQPCRRPEQVELLPDECGTAVVQSSRQLGDLAESDLRHASGVERRFWHRTGRALLPGMRVVVRLLALCLALGLSVSCSEGARQALAFAHVRHLPLPPEGQRAPAPRGVAATADGWIVLDDAGRVLVLDHSAAVVRHWRMPASSAGNPEGVCLLRDGRIAVADTHYHRVVFFDGEGHVLSTLGGEGRDPGQFIYPIKVAQDAHGDLLVAEYGGNDRVQKFTNDGAFVLAFGAFGTEPGCFQRPSGLVCRDDTVWVSDALSNRVQEFASDGSFRRVLVAAGPPMNLRLPYELALGPDGLLYVIEHDAGRLSAFTLRGELAGSFGEIGRGAGQFATPWGLGVDARGIVLIADTGNRRLVELRR
jgi:ABC-type multidrug transport system ATPase subunit